jgi:cobalamin-dependent methionine synthase I
MTFVVETVRAVTDLPLFLDTINPAALEAGLAACGGQAIINGFSLELDKIARVLLSARKLARLTGDPHAYLFYATDTLLRPSALER